MTSKDTDDVLDFINSLPESKGSTPKPEGKEDLLEFLDELAAHDKAPVKSKKLAAKRDRKPEKKEEQEKEEVKQDAETKGTAAPAGGDAAAELEIDPISSITNWWNSEGSSKVSNLWGSLAANAQTVSDATYKIATDTTNQLNAKRQEFLKDQEENSGKSLEQISNLTNKLNSVLANIGEQISNGIVGQEDELLNIIIVNDLDNFTYLNDLVWKNFHRVMGQVEGGIRISLTNYNSHKESSKLNLNMFYGKLIDGEKLCYANLDSSVKNFNKAVEFEKNENTSLNDQMESISKSNIFISIQPISTNKANGEVSEDQTIVTDQSNGSSFSFTLILKDISNNITIVTKTQPFPLVWSKWLVGEELDKFEALPDIDPKEWVKDWIKEGLNLSLGVLAQQYVIKRMGF